MIKCITIDDEPLALKQMEAYVNKTPFLELIGSYSSAIEVLEVVNLDEVDLIFADIDMPDCSGLDLMKSVGDRCKVIFTTAHSKYAVEGFKVEAIDYLLKPISYADFLISANRAKKHFEKVVQPTTSESDKEFIFIKSEHKYIKVELGKILFIKGEREYVKIVLDDESSIMTLMNMKKVEEQLPQNSFMRVHRSYIVNLYKLEKVDRNFIVYSTGDEVPVSDQHKEKLLGFIEEHFL